MRLYREFSSRDSASVRTPRNPTALTVATSTLAGAAIESPTAVNDGATGRYRVDTTDALYTVGTVYRIAWTATILGSTFTRTLRYRHCQPGSGDTTPPGPPTIGISSVDATSVVIAHTPPSDADYDHTLIFCVPLSGGAVVTGTGSGSTITVSGLNASTSYMAIGIAYDTSGNGSAPALATVALFTTLSQALTANRIVCKWWGNDSDTQYEFSPQFIDPSRTGAHRVGWNMMRARHGRFCIECDEPVPVLRIRGVSFVIETPSHEPGGMRNDYGN